MLRSGAAALAILASGLSGCSGGGGKADAALSAQRLLAAAQAGDRMAFEAEIDRPAVREDVRRQMVELARQKGLEVEGGPSDLALDRMVSPDAVRALSPPQPGDVAARLKTVGEGQLCLPAESGDCLLTFARRKKHWRLVGMQARDLSADFTPDRAAGA